MRREAPVKNVHTSPTKAAGANQLPQRMRDNPVMTTSAA
jgi:hypothetical protein